LDADALGDAPWPPSDKAISGEPADVAAGRLTGVGAFDPGRRGVKALAAVAAVVVVVAAFLAWRARPQVEPVPAPDTGVAAGDAAPPGAPAPGPGAGGSQPVGFEPGGPQPVGPAPSGPGRAGAAPAGTAPAGPATGGPAASAAEVVVAVGGKVHRPGLVRLAPGARVADALQAAGGAHRGVDVALLNLARKVADGELIMVGVTPPPGTPAANPAASGGASPGAGPVNLNTATVADLDTLPGVGPVLAQRIVDHREQHGAFAAVSDLRKIEGIGSARYDQLKDLVTV
jgi:competence protein ComEA